MGFHDVEFIRSQCARFLKNAVFNSDLADIMQLSRNPYNFEKLLGMSHFSCDHQRITGNTVGVSTSVWIFFIDRSGEHLDRTHKQLTIFGGSTFEVEHELLEVLGHGIEGCCQFADLGAARELNAM